MDGELAEAVDDAMADEWLRAHLAGLYDALAVDPPPWRVEELVALVRRRGELGL